MIKKLLHKYLGIDYIKQKFIYNQFKLIFINHNFYYKNYDSNYILKSNDINIDDYTPLVKLLHTLNESYRNTLNFHYINDSLTFNEVKKRNEILKISPDQNFEKYFEKRIHLTYDNIVIYPLSKIDIDNLEIITISIIDDDYFLVFKPISLESFTFRVSFERPLFNIMICDGIDGIEQYLKDNLYNYLKYN